MDEKYASKEQFQNIMKIVIDLQMKVSCLEPLVNKLAKKSDEVDFDPEMFMRLCTGNIDA